jgi:predicted DNA-binding transcriptional regulator YafY
MAATSSRMLALLSLLQSQRDWPGGVLAERLGVTPRTVRRDIDKLRELGYRIGAIKGPDGGYRLAAGSELPPLLFDDEQAIAIAVALRAAPSTGVDIDDAAVRALATVRQVMPARLRNRVDGIEFSDSEVGSRVDPRVLETVSTAVREHRTLRFDYGDTVDGPPRHAEPHAVVANGGRWYLIAWVPDRGDWRIFRLDRLAPLSHLGAVFRPREIPGGDATTFLAARFKGSHTVDRWPVYGEFLLDLPASEVRPYLGDGELAEVSATQCRVRVGSWSWTGLIAWILRFDADFEVVGPAELVDAAGRLSQRLGSAHRER